jgi:hypothetical protein
MRRFILAPVLALGLAATAHGQWTADFNTDGGFDGMTEFQNGSTSKPLFDANGASGGRLVVVTHDGENYAGVHDKGGRSLGATLNMGTSSVSAYYKFNWDQLNELATETWVAAEFLGDSQVHSSREAIGALLRFTKSGSDYYVNVGGQFGGSGGYTNNGYKAGTNVNLGPNPIPGLSGQHWGLRRGSSDQ